VLVRPHVQSSRSTAIPHQLHEIAQIVVVIAPVIKQMKTPSKSSICLQFLTIAQNQAQQVRKYYILVYPLKFRQCNPTNYTNVQKNIALHLLSMPSLYKMSIALLVPMLPRFFSIVLDRLLPMLCQFILSQYVHINLFLFSRISPGNKLSLITVLYTAPFNRHAFQTTIPKHQAILNLVFFCK
jgi:hypothetical protein